MPMPVSMCDKCHCHPCVCEQPEPSDDGWLHSSATRRVALTLSLASFFLLLPPALAQRGPRPPKPPTRKVCPTCHGTGQIMISGGQSRRCPRCGGKGFLPA